MIRNISTVVFLVFVLFTARDLVVKFIQPTETSQSKSPSSPSPSPSPLTPEDSSSSSPIDGGGGDIHKEIPSMSFHNAASMSTIKILYCYSCGYAQAFKDYKQLLNERFPDLNVVGANYAPSFFKTKLVSALSIAKMIIILLLLTNINPFTHFAITTPRVWHWMTEHKLYACMMTFFLCNSIESSLMSSGAFEVYYNDVQVWSKIASGRVPTPQELFSIIDNYQHKFLPTGPGGGNMFANDDGLGSSFVNMPGHRIL